MTRMIIPIRLGKYLSSKVVLALALTFLAAVALRAHVFPPSAQVHLNAQTIGHSTGNLYTVGLNFKRQTGFFVDADGEHGENSILELFEDGKRLGPSKAHHDRIAKVGNGQFSFWNNTLYFSASDNSDPRINGKIYQARSKMSLIPSFKIFLYAASILSLIAVILSLRGAVKISKQQFYVAGLSIALGICGAVAFNYKLSYSYVLVAVILASLIVARTQISNKVTNWIIEFVKDRDVFKIYNVESEIIKLNVLRIILGICLLFRTFGNLVFVSVGDVNSAHIMLLCLVIIAATFLIIGLFVPLAALCLFVFNRQIDLNIGSYTLSTDVLQMLLIIIIFTPLGTRLSMRSSKRFNGLLGVPTTERIRVVKFAAAMSYGLLCLFSVLEHFFDDGWMKGYVIAQALTSPATSPRFEAFRTLQNLSPQLFFGTTQFLTLVMIAWELLFIPLLLAGRAYRHFAILWGLSFICVSSLFLNVQWLPSYELILWGMLFWSKLGLNIDRKADIEIFYDDRCNLCDRTVRSVRMVDLFSVTNFSPLSLNKDRMQSLGVSTAQALTDLVGVDAKSGKIIAGYEFYIELTKRVMLLWPLWPVLTLGYATGIGPAIYRFIADRRTRLFGVCTRAPEYQPPKEPTMVERPFVVRAFVISYLVMTALFMYRTPMAREWFKVPTWTAFNATAIYGLTPINVFNQSLMPLAENYFTITARTRNGDNELLPFIGKKGEHLSWQLWSDQAFIGGGLSWKIARMGTTSPCYIAKNDDALFKKIIDYYGADEKTDSFRVDYFHQRLPVYPDFASGLPLPFKPERTCSISIDARSGSVSRIAHSEDA